MTKGYSIPKYRCHKEVGALKIEYTVADTSDHGVELHFVDEKFAPRIVDLKVVSRYFPKPGDYFVVYEDGYESISPAKAFEEGYRRIEE